MKLSGQIVTQLGQDFTQPICPAPFFAQMRSGIISAQADAPDPVIGTGFYQRTSPRSQQLNQELSILQEFGLVA